MVTLQKDLADFPTFHVMFSDWANFCLPTAWKDNPQPTLGDYLHGSSIQLSDHITKTLASVRKGGGRRGAEGVEPSASLEKEEWACMKTKDELKQSQADR
jgi:hypothetical protein